MKKMTKLIPHGGVKYDDAKKGAQEFANEQGKPVALWFNGKREVIKPNKNSHQ